MDLLITERKEIVHFQCETETFRYSGSVEIANGESNNINISVHAKSGEYVGSIGDTLTGHVSMSMDTKQKLSVIVTEYEQVKAEALHSTKQ